MSHDTQEAPERPPARSLKRAVWIGVALWLAFCAVAVVLRGIRWDETYEHAQVITRQVPYPEGHPLFRYTRGAFSLQTYSAALLMLLGAGPAILCGLRNLLFLAATVMPVFLLATLLTRKPVWGHAAALLALMGVYLEFDGSYPIAVWPDLFSNGHIGGGYALLVLCALCAGRSRSGFFLLGLMPCIHIGQMPVLLALAPLYAITMWRQRRRQLVSALAYGALGLAICAAFFLTKQHFAVAPPTQGPYNVQADPWPIWHGYTARHDIHRAFPPGNGHIVLAGALLLTAAAAYWETRRKTGTVPASPTAAFTWLFLYTLGTAAAVWGIMAIHAIMGADVPFLLIAWMPYRLINHIPPLLLAATVGILAKTKTVPRDLVRAGTVPVFPNPGPLIVLAALTFCILRPLFAPILGDRLFNLYIAAGDAVFFGLLGAAYALIQTRLKGDRPFAIASNGVGAAALLTLGLYHQFGLACVLAGWLISRIQGPSPFFGPLSRHSLTPRAQAVAGTVICLLACLSLLGNEWRWRTHLPVSPFDRSVTRELAKRSEPYAMLVAAPDEFILQARTGHPVLVETATPSLISYMPSLAPAIQQIYQDLYGIRFDLPPDPAAPTWQQIWAERSQAQWQALGSKYGFRYIIAPATPSIDLPPVIQDRATSLYELPSD